MDITAILGPLIGVGAILLGQALEGGHASSLMQITAAIIVYGGTLGAVVLSFPQEHMILAVKKLAVVFGNQTVELKEIITEIVKYATKARKEGVIALEKEAKNASDPIITLGLEAVADGADPKLVRDMLEIQIGMIEEESKHAYKVWEAAGAYSPTVGIIGAVLGLIHVMGNLSDPSKLGSGIAVAFVATVYGLVGANLFFIPFSTKIKLKEEKLIQAKEMMLEGILAIQAGESPALIERKLQAYILETEGNGAADGQKVPA